MNKDCNIGKIRESLSKSELASLVPLADRLGSNYTMKDGFLCQVITKGDANREYIYLLNGVVEAVSEVTKDNGQDVERCLNVVFHCANGKIFSAQISTKDIYNATRFRY